MSDRLTLSHLQQSQEGRCLSACARMVVAHLGITLSEAEISRVLGARDFGAPSFAIQQLTSLGFQVIYREWSIPQAVDTLHDGIPLIIFVRTAFLEYWNKDVAHAVILIDAEENQRFWLHDPALSNSPTTVSWDGLLAAWAEFGYRGAQISRM
jgi:ABC-type bacteriocin/lantibiotic exporter with double-glycine peptidase domain